MCRTCERGREGGQLRTIEPDQQAGGCAHQTGRSQEVDVLIVFLPFSSRRRVLKAPEKTQGSGENSRLRRRLKAPEKTPWISESAIASSSSGARAVRWSPSPKQLPNKDLSPHKTLLRPPHARAAGAPGASGARRT